MNAWLIDEPFPATVRVAQPGTAPAHSNRAETSAPLLTQIEQVLGEENEPDAAFFVESWTVGVAAASENFLRRQEEQQTLDHVPSAWNTFPSFTPFFVPGAEAVPGPAWPLRQAPANQPEHRGDEEEENTGASDEAAIAGPLTVESACRLLGVTAMSTREQLRAAYHRMANRYHPDRIARRGAREQKLAGDRMASINEAYRLLCIALAG